MAVGAPALDMGLLVAVPTVASASTVPTVAEPTSATDPVGPGAFTHPDQVTIDDSITELDPKTTDLKQNVVDAQTTMTEGDSTVVTLNTDILFDSAKLKEQGEGRRPGSGEEPASRDHLRLNRVMVESSLIP